MVKAAGFSQASYFSMVNQSAGFYCLRRFYGLFSRMTNVPDIKLCNDSKNEVGRGYSVLLNRVATRCPPYHDGRDDLRRRLMIDIFDKLMTIK